MYTPQSYYKKYGCVRKMLFKLYYYIIIRGLLWKRSFHNIIFIWFLSRFECIICT